jgi:ABC-type transporter Mla maintaining outer membrane lipid asymmetry ATPase subunit MlaF
MTRSGAPMLEMAGISKAFGGLRPLRLGRLDLQAGDRVALTGLDGPAAEVLVNLLTGASLPDQGRVSLFGTDTAAIDGPEAWLALLERLGIVSARAVLLDALSVAQNIATSFTLSIDPVADAVMTDVRRLAGEVGLSPSDLDGLAAAAQAEVRVRCHLAKALALDPSFLVLEHANALAAGGAGAFARIVKDVARGRGLTLLALTADDAFGRAAADRVLAVNPATGALTDRSGWRRMLPGA